VVVLRAFNGISFLLAVILLLAFLVVRPHLGSVSKEYLDVTSGTYLATNGMHVGSYPKNSYPTREKCDRDAEKQNAIFVATAAALYRPPGGTPSPHVGLVPGTAPPSTPPPVNGTPAVGTDPPIMRCQTTTQLLWGW
jgi:hypothetical protein